jgi:hypothetical protein
MNEQTQNKKIQVEFTDRYGGNAPSWLRGCFECEAMGSYPVKAHGQLTEAEATNQKLVVWDDHNDYRRALSAYEDAAVQRRIVRHGLEADGWYFIPCRICSGTGRASWLRTLTRIPRWLWKGVPFTFIHAPRASSHMSYWSAAWLGFKCAYLVDLNLWKP